MNFLNKKTRLRLMAQILTATSIVGMNYGTKSINANALDATTASDVSAGQDLLTDAIEKVATAELTKSQDDVNIAQTAIDSLTDGADKNNLQNRINIVQNDIDNGILTDVSLTTAIDAVSKAENTRLQADIDSARILVKALPDSTVKTDLTNRLEAIDSALQYTLKLADATKAVITAETTKSQTDVTSATILVNNLSDGTSKTDLLNRLKAVQVEIDIINKQISTATDAVTKAETSTLQTDVDYARTLVTALPDGTTKSDLSNQLETVQTSIDLATQIAKATNAVVQAETTKLQSDVDYARSLVNALPSGTTKTELSNRLDNVQATIDKSAQDALAIKTATDAVVQAETTKTQTDVDSATTLVKALPEGIIKTDLTNRLAVVQSEIDKSNQDTLAVKTATNAVVQAETTKTQANVDSARILVNALPSGTVKTDLTNRLDNVQATIDKSTQDATAIKTATDAVAKAETSNLQTDVDSAKSLVDALPDGTTKTDLTNRLDVVQTTIDKSTQDSTATKKATDTVAKAETTKTQADVDSARTLVNALPSGTVKTDLTKRLEAVQAIINKSVENKDNHKDKDKDKEKDDQKGNSHHKDSRDNKKLQEAVDAVERFEKLLDNESCHRAVNKVKRLPYGSDKTELLNRINKGIIKMYGLEFKNSKYKNLNKDFNFYRNLLKIQSEIKGFMLDLNNDSFHKAIDKIKTLPDCKEKDDLLNNVSDNITKMYDLEISLHF